MCTKHSPTGVAPTPPHAMRRVGHIHVVLLLQPGPLPGAAAALGAAAPGVGLVLRQLAHGAGAGAEDHG